MSAYRSLSTRRLFTEKYFLSPQLVFILVRSGWKWERREEKGVEGLIRREKMEEGCPVMGTKDCLEKGNWIGSTQDPTHPQHLSLQVHVCNGNNSLSPESPLRVPRGPYMSFYFSWIAFHTVSPIKRDR